MKKITFLIVSILLFTYLIIYIFNYEEKNKFCSYDKVVKIYDWDTIYWKNLWKIRLLGIDTPEFYHKKYWLLEHKFYGCPQKAKDIANEKLLWKKIMFCKDPLSSKEWDYWRKLRYAMILSWNQQISFWEYLLEKWFAKVYKYAEFKLKEKYNKIEKNNKANKFWIWSKTCLINDQETKQKYSSWCNIKWNIKSNWEKVYYLPEDPYYWRVKINQNWEKLFCDYKKAEKKWFIRIWN